MHLSYCAIYKIKMIFLYINLREPNRIIIARIQRQHGNAFQKHEKPIICHHNFTYLFKVCDVVVCFKNNTKAFTEQ